jgi:hypothetical protein
MFTFEYDATQGVRIAAALRDQAKAERIAAKQYRDGAHPNAPMRELYMAESKAAENRAQLLEDAADKIHAPVTAAIAEEMSRLA